MMHQSEHSGQTRNYGCGGYSSYSGHCGATDCPTCYPGQDSGHEPERERPWLADAGYSISGDGEWEKQISRKTRTARRDHADGKVKAGDKYRVTTTRWINDESGESNLTHRKVVIRPDTLTIVDINF